MSELADLLELVHGARRRWRTARLVLRRWYDHERAPAPPPGPGSPASSTARAEGAAASWEVTTHLWLDPPGDRVRADRAGPTETVATVRVGHRWWTYGPASGAVTNEDDLDVTHGGGTEADDLLDPARLLPLFDVETVGATQVAGRDGIVVRAVPRPFLDRDRSWDLPAGTDECELVVDAERGVLLRYEARAGGTPFSRHEIVEIAFDEEFADDVFVIELPEGETFGSVRDAFPQPEAVSLEEAVRAAPFTVLAPTLVPEGWRIEVMLLPPIPRRGAEAGVSIQLVGPDRAHRVVIHQWAEALPDSLDWTPVEVEGAPLLVCTPHGAGTRVEVKLDRDGTHARLSGDVDRDTMLALAASLRPAPAHLPPLAPPS